MFSVPKRERPAAEESKSSTERFEGSKAPHEQASPTEMRVSSLEPLVTAGELKQTTLVVPPVVVQEIPVESQVEEEEMRNAMLGSEILQFVSGRGVHPRAASGAHSREPEKISLKSPQLDPGKRKDLQPKKNISINRAPTAMAKDQ